MGRYIIRRLLQAIPLLFLVSIFMFAVIHALPGGPEAVIFNPHLDAAGRAALRARFGLDYAVAIQYFKWLGRDLSGDFGFSFVTNEPVTDILGQRFPVTLHLFSSALILALFIAITLGVLSAVRQRTIVDYTLTTLSYFGIAMPIFLFGLFAQDIFGVWLHWLPTSGTQSFGYTFDPFGAFLDHLSHLVLPMLVLAISFIAGWSRYMRSSMIEVIKQDYIRTARAKGVAPIPVLLRHALRNPVLPLITVLPIDFRALAVRALTSDGVFACPGMGKLFIDSLEPRDFPVLFWLLLLGAVVSSA